MIDEAKLKELRKHWIQCDPDCGFDPNDPECPVDFDELADTIEALWDGNYAAMVEELKAACDEARAKENARGRIILDKMIDKSFAEGFSDAIERAANIAELNIGLSRPAIAIEIRALKPGEE